MPSISDNIMNSLSAYGPGTMVDRERKRLEAVTGSSKKSLADMYKIANEPNRVANKKV